MWVRLAQELVDAQMGHGDLQHGNVMLVPRGQTLALRLISITMAGTCRRCPRNPRPSAGTPTINIRNGSTKGDIRRRWIAFLTF